MPKNFINPDIYTDPEPFGPLTAKPMNLREQLYSFVPQTIKNQIDTFKNENHKSNDDKIDNFDFQRLPEDQKESVCQFLMECDQKSISTTIDRFLHKFSHESFASLKWDQKLIDLFVKLNTKWCHDKQSIEFNFEHCKVMLCGLELAWCKFDQPDESVETMFCYLQHFLKSTIFSDLSGKFLANLLFRQFF